MKTLIVAALICLNVGLLAALVWTATPAALGQADSNQYFRDTNYVMVAGNLETGYEALYIIDMGSQQLLGLKYDRTNKRLLPLARRNLKSDFRLARGR